MSSPPIPSVPDSVVGVLVSGGWREGAGNRGQALGPSVVRTVPGFSQIAPRRGIWKQNQGPGTTVGVLTVPSKGTGYAFKQ